MIGENMPVLKGIVVVKQEAEIEVTKEELVTKMEAFLSPADLIENACKRWLFSIGIFCSHTSEVRLKYFDGNQTYMWQITGQGFSFEWEALRRGFATEEEIRIWKSFENLKSI